VTLCGGNILGQRFFLASPMSALGWGAGVCSQFVPRRKPGPRALESQRCVVPLWAPAFAGVHISIGNYRSLAVAPPCRAAMGRWQRRQPLTEGPTPSGVARPCGPSTTRCASGPPPHRCATGRSERPLPVETCRPLSDCPRRYGSARHPPKAGRASQVGGRSASGRGQTAVGNRLMVPPMARADGGANANNAAPDRGACAMLPCLIEPSGESRTTRG